MANPLKHVLDSQMLGMVQVEKLQAAIKCTKGTPKEDNSVVVMVQNKIQLQKCNADQAPHSTNALISLNDYLFSCSKLLELCEASEDLNQLYTKTYTKIDAYDEEEQCTVSPSTSNGYVF